MSRVVIDAETGARYSVYQTQTLNATGPNGQYYHNVIVPTPASYCPVVIMFATAIPADNTGELALAKTEVENLKRELRLMRERAESAIDFLEGN